MNKSNKLISKIISLLENDESNLLDTSNFKKIGSALGSNSGGTFESPEGKKYYIKQSRTGEHARNEVLYSHMLRHMGVPVLKHQLVKHHGELAVASPLEKLEPYDNSNHEQNKEVASHLGPHAFISNWDALGTMGKGGDNYSKNSEGRMIHLDTGGSGKFRARGESKGPAFGTSVGEFDSIRDPKLNPKNAHVFSHMKPQDLVDTVKPVANFRNKDIHYLIQQHGPIDPHEKEELTHKMITRKKDLISRANTIASQHGLSKVKDIDD